MEVDGSVIYARMAQPFAAFHDEEFRLWLAEGETNPGPKVVRGSNNGILVELVGAYSNQALQSQKLRDLRRQIPEIGDLVASKAPKRRQKQKRLSAAQLESLAHDYRSGIPIRDIASKYQVNRDTVNNHVRRMKLPNRYSPRS